MASKATWAKVKHFSPSSKIDNWGDPDAIKDRTVLSLDDFRRGIACPIYVLGAVAKGGHSTGSEHYAQYNQSGELVKEPSAADIIMPNYGASPWDLILEATRYGFTGIGYYPHWRWDGEIVGGLHVDCRELKTQADGTLDYRHSRWMGVPDGNGGQKYIALSFDNMIKYANFSKDDILEMH